MTMSTLSDFHLQNDDFEFSNAKKWKFRKKIPLETDFEAYRTILKKSIFLGPKTKNMRKIEISKNMTMSALGNLHPQNHDLEFSSAEKRKFRKKIPLETDFEAYWMILKKSIFLALRSQTGTKNVKKIEIPKKWPCQHWAIYTTKMAI